jgi:hypothetical protein
VHLVKPQLAVVLAVPILMAPLQMEEAAVLAAVLAQRVALVMVVLQLLGKEMLVEVGLQQVLARLAAVVVLEVLEETHQVLALEFPVMVEWGLTGNPLVLSTLAAVEAAHLPQVVIQPLRVLAVLVAVRQAALPWVAARLVIQELRTQEEAVAVLVAITPFPTVVALVVRA